MKGLTEIKGLRGIKTLGVSGKRSIPRMQSSIYLDIFVLRKEKERLEKEIFIFEKKVGEDREKLNDIVQKIEGLEREDAGRRKKSGSGKRGRPETELKKMALEY